MHETNTIHTKIILLFNGEASSEVKKEIGAWLSQSEENKKLYTDLQEIWLTSGISKNADRYKLKKATRNFKQRIKSNSEILKMRSISDILKYAAIVILLLSLPVTYFLGRNGSQATESFATITCAFGDKSTVTLPDGSLAYLNSGSKLTFNNDFQNECRMVYLEGEAYFSVKKNKKIPFKVKAAEIEIEVFGTEFNLKAYPDENTISTTLAKGCIQIKSEFQQSIMEPNQKIVFTRTDNKMRLFELENITPETEWREGRMVFRNESLEEMELKLERWFDVDIIFADKEVKKRRFTGALERESILEAISYFNCSEHVGYKIDGNEIIFYSN